MSMPIDALKYYYCKCKYELQKGSVKGLKAKELFKFVKLTDDLQVAISQKRVVDYDEVVGYYE